jgi:hypothetical protein
LSGVVALFDAQVGIRTGLSTRHCQESIAVGALHFSRCTVAERLLGLDAQCLAAIDLDHRNAVKGFACGFWRAGRRRATVRAARRLP